MKDNGSCLLKRVLVLILLLSVLIPSSAVGAAAEEEEFFLSENYALGKSAYVNNAYSKAPKEAAVDGDIASLWRTNSTCKDDFIYFVVSFGEITDINVISLMLYNSERMSTVKLQYTTDASPSASSAWNDIKVLENDDLTPSMAIGFDTVKATGIRFYSELSVKSAGLYELQVYYTNDIDTATDKLSRSSFNRFTQPESIDAEIVSLGDNGELIYADCDGNGATLLDYSYVGYKRGEAAIPDVKVVKVLEAGEHKDHTAMIQNAIDEIAALPEDERGAILLKAGKYTVSSEISITASGIVLRGEGQGDNGTVIYDVRTNSETTTLRIMGANAYSTVAGTKKKLVSGYVPMGERVLRLSDVDVYKTGDTVRVVCTPNELWIKTLGTDIIPGDNAVQWRPSAYVMTYERRITDVDAAGGSITVDTGIPLTLDEKYFSVTVEKIEDSKGRITECGVENIRFLSYYNGTRIDEDHAWTAVALYNCRDCWVRNVTSKHYAYATVKVARGAINVTVEGCSYLEPVSSVTGGRRYSFCIDGGQYTLVKNCYSHNSRHDYVVQARVCGPNVFLDCVAEDSYSVSEPHHRWSNGTLYDNVYQIGRIRLGYFEAINRGNSGTGHGWGGASTVFWNCLSPAIVVGKPQTEQNFAVGVYGIFTSVDKSRYLSMYENGFIVPSIVTPGYPEVRDHKDSPMYGNAYIEAPYNPVDPSSLYRAQLAYRLIGDATKNIAPNAPILEYPMADSKSKSYSVTFSGICDQNADKVYVYVDGEGYEAEILDREACTYSVKLYLDNGYHDVFVTQTIGGEESSPNALRTILVDSDDAFDPSRVIGPDVMTESNMDPPKTVAPDVTSGDDIGSDNEDHGTDGGGEKSFFIVLAVGVAGCTAVGLGVFFFVKRFRRV